MSRSMAENEVNTSVFSGGTSDAFLDATHPEELSQRRDDALQREREEQERRRQALRENYVTSKDENPDELASDSKAAATRGIPVPVARANRDRIRDEDELKRLDDVARLSPKSAGWLSDRRNYRLAKDDIQQMGLFEKLSKAFTNRASYRAKATPKEFMKGMAEESTKAATMLRNMEVRGADRDMMKAYDTFGPDSPEFEQAVLNRANVLVNGGRFGNRLKRDVALEAEYAGDLKQVMLNYYMNQPQTDGFGEDVAVTVASSAVDTIAALSIGFLTRSPSAGGAAFALPVYGESYNQATLFEGLEREDAQRFGAIQAGLEFVTERFAIGKLLNGKKSFLKRLGESAAAESGGEIVTEAGQSLNEKMFFEPEKSLYDHYITEAGDRGYELAVAGTAGLASSGVFNTPLIAADMRIQDLNERARRANMTEGEQQIEDMWDAASAMKLRERDPDAFEDSIEALTESGVDALILDASSLVDSLEQDGGDATSALKAMGLNQEQIQQARDVGGELTVRVSQLLKNKAVDEHRASIEPHLKRPGDLMTAAERQGALEGIQEEMMNASKAFQAAMEEAAEQSADVFDLREHLHEKLSQIAVNAPETIDAEAELAAQLISTWSQTLDMTIEELTPVIEGVFDERALQQDAVFDQQFESLTSDPLINEGAWRETAVEVSTPNGTLTGAAGKVYDQLNAAEGDVSASMAALREQLLASGLKVEQVMPGSYTQEKGSADTLKDMVRDGRFEDFSDGRLSAALNQQVMLAKNGLSDKQIGDLVGKTKEQVHSNLARARKTFGIEIPDGRNTGKASGRSTAKRELYPLFAQGLTDKEIADQTGKTVNNVKQQRYQVRQKLKAGEPLWDDKALNSGRRGQFSPSNRAIRLFAGRADASTFMHEMSHYYLDLLARTGAQSENQQVAQFANKQLAAIYEWSGYAVGTPLYDEMGVPTVEGREIHETFAEAFEVYLRAGKAPTKGLRDVFRKFKVWLMKIYTSPHDNRIRRAMKAGMTPEITAVFDRMVATDTQINAATAARDQTATQMADDMLAKGIITKAQHTRLGNNLDDAREKAKEDMLAMLIEQYTAAETAAYEQAKRRARRAARERYDTSAVGRALAWLGRGEWMGEIPRGQQPYVDALEQQRTLVDRMRAVALAMETNDDGSPRFTYQQIADQIGKSIGAVRHYMFDAQAQGFELPNRQPQGAASRSTAGPSVYDKVVELSLTGTNDDGTRMNAHEIADEMDTTVDSVYVMQSKARKEGFDIPSNAELNRTKKKGYQAYDLRITQGLPWEAVVARLNARFPDNPTNVNSAMVMVNREGKKRAEEGFAQSSRKYQLTNGGGLGNIQIANTWQEIRERGLTNTLRDRLHQLLESKIEEIEVDLETSTEARRARARAQGFNVDTVFWHGSPERDIRSFQRSSGGLYGQGVYVTPNKGFAAAYKKPHRRLGDMRVEEQIEYAFRGRRYALYLRGEAIDNGEYMRRLRLHASDMPTDYFKTQKWLNSPEGQRAQEEVQEQLLEEGITHLNANKDVTLVFDPKDVRSVEAVFDPAARESSDILAQDGPRSMRSAMQFTPEARKEWFDESVDERKDGTSTYLSITSNLIYDEVEIHISSGIEVEFSVEGLQFNSAQPTPKDVAKATRVMAHVTLALQEWLKRNDVPFMGFVGATPAHNRLYESMLSRFDLTGYLGYKINSYRAMMNVDADGTKHADAEPHDAQPGFLIIKDGYEQAAIHFLKTQPDGLSATSNTFQEGGGIITKRLDTTRPIWSRRVGEANRGRDGDAGRSGSAGDGSAVSGSDVTLQPLNPPDTLEQNNNSKWGPVQPPEDVQRVRLDLDAVEEAFGKEAVRALPRAVKRAARDENLPMGSIDEVARMLGFESGEAMITALTEDGRRQEAVDRDTQEALDDEFGADFENGTMELRAQEMAESELVDRINEVELDALMRAIGTGPANRLAKQMAKDLLSTMTVLDIQRWRRFRQDAERSAEKSLKSLNEGDLLGAHHHKLREMINRHMYREGEKMATHLDKVREKIRKYDMSEGTRKRIDPEYLERIDAVLQDYELRVSYQSGRKPARSASAQAWVAEMIAEGRESEITPEAIALAEKAGKKRWITLTVDEADYLLGTIENLAHLGRTKSRLLHEREVRDFNLTIDSLVDTLEAAPTNKNVPAREMSATPTISERAKGKLRGFHAALTRPEYELRTLDGKENGPLWNTLFRPFAEAADVESSKLRDLAKEMKALYTKLGVVGLFDNELTDARKIVDFPGKRLTQMDVIVVALNWGNQGNRDALMQGYGWKKEQVEALLTKYMRDKHWDFVEGVWDLIHSLQADSFALQKDITGVEPLAVEGLEFEIGGRKVKGQYYPLKYSGDLPTAKSATVFKMDEKEALSELGKSFIAPATRTGHLIERSGSGGKPVKLSIGVFHQHIQNVVHDIAYRRAVIDANRIINNDRFKQAYMDAAGLEQYRELQPWLAAVATERDLEPGSQMANILSAGRMNFSAAVMGYKLGTALQQITGVLAGATIIGTGYTALGFHKALRAGPASFWSAWKAVSAKSEFMKDRPMGFDRDVRQITTQFQERGSIVSGSLSRIRRNAFVLLGLFDGAVSTAVWIGAYHQALDGNAQNIEAGNEVDAIAYADSVVRRTQTAGRAQDLPRVMRGTELEKMLTAVYSYFSGMYNLVASNISETRNGQMKAHQFIGNMAILFVFIPAMAGWLAGRYDEEDERDQKILGHFDTGNEFTDRVTNEVLGNAVGTVPILRDIGNTWLKPQYGYQLTPASMALEELGSLGPRVLTGELFDDDVKKSEVRNVANVLGAVFGLPAAQMMVTGDYLYDVATGEEEIGDEGPIDELSEALVRDTG